MRSSRLKLQGSSSGRCQDPTVVLLLAHKKAAHAPCGMQGITGACAQDDAWTAAQLAAARWCGVQEWSLGSPETGIHCCHALLARSTSQQRKP